jgi:hypothetical protein
MENYEKNWEEFWKDIVTRDDGSIDLEQIKKELSDYRFLLEEIPKVYSHITNKLSYPNYYANTIIQEADYHYQKVHGDIIRDNIGEIINDKDLGKDEMIRLIREYIKSY